MIFENELKKAKQPTVVTIGNFDGVHLGHQCLLQQVINKAQSLGAVSTVIIFSPQPLEFFRAQDAPARLTSREEKIYWLKQAGIEQVICLPFTPRLAGLSAREFVETILHQALGAIEVIIGDDFHFGHNREGNLAFLQGCASEFGFNVVSTESVVQAGQRVSSSQIRKALEDGDFATVNTLLGRDYTLRGTVIQGKQLGRQWGVPTANIALARLVSPLHGIYVCEMQIEGGEKLPAVASIGSRPAVDDGEFLCEVHLLDKNIDCYDKSVEVTFLHKLRDEENFHDLEALKAQIYDDVAQARAFFKTRNVS